jgi:mannose-6-phosphate isomerase-like protein (cupin superfamily)
MSLDRKSLERQLHSEGFLHTYVWQDGPNAFYPDHTHAIETAHIILDGEMTLTQGGGPHTYGVGQRCDVPAGAVHSARWARTVAAISSEKDRFSRLEV